MNLVSWLITKTRTIYFYENIYSLQFHTFTLKSLESGPSRDPEENLICIVLVKLGLFKVVGMLVDEFSKCTPQLRIPF